MLSHVQLVPASGVVPLTGPGFAIHIQQITGMASPAYQVVPQGQPVLAQSIVAGRTFPIRWTGKADLTGCPPGTEILVSVAQSEWEAMVLR